MAETELPLRDIHLPEAISGWSLAIGWWVLLILIPLSCFFGYWLFKRVTRKTAIKTAKKLLKNLKVDDSQTAREKLEIISAVLRRVAMSLNSRSDCAGLTGEAWLLYLDSLWEENAFSEGSGKILISGRFQKQQDDIDIDELITLTERWLKGQKL
ncbi:MAG: DUF4381 domain-containing protein [Methylococcales bacterium]|nr:DUF4381 domain-containing protein [Methylococcales bacterium]